ncbi:MAG: hypothetical protein QMC37_01060, partial [Flavobacteriales bacterium]
MLSGIYKAPFKTECGVDFLKAAIQTILVSGSNVGSFIRFWTLSQFDDMEVGERAALDALKSISSSGREQVLNVANFAMCHCTPDFAKAIFMVALNPLNDEQLDNLFATLISVTWKLLRIPWHLMRSAFASDNGTELLRRLELILHDMDSMVTFLASLMYNWVESFIIEILSVMKQIQGRRLLSLVTEGGVPDFFAVLVLPFHVIIEMIRVVIKVFIRSGVLLGGG